MSATNEKLDVSELFACLFHIKCKQWRSFSNEKWGGFKVLFLFSTNWRRMLEDVIQEQQSGEENEVQIYMLRLIMWYAMSLNCDKWHTANSILTYNFVFFYLYLYFIFCSGSVKRHPQNQMLGRRELVDGKVRYCMPKQLHLYCCLVG